MLYDNGQMASLYSEGFTCFKSDLYKQTVYETLEFIERELSSPEGGFYSALDADSEGVEGKYYCWTAGEIAQAGLPRPDRSEEHTSELQSLMRISYAVFCLKKKIQT